MNPTLRHITFDYTGEPYELARWWSDFLGRQISDTDEPGDNEVLIELPAGAPGLLFIRTGDPKKTNNRLHFALAPAGRTRSEEVERAVALGARVEAGVHATAARTVLQNQQREEMRAAMSTVLAGVTIT
ncbi:VOC family protein [Streptomyces sp. NPDC057837]|uniref:VOC family protein n=1 Tax=Streptomyces sp. NPDC057837 TaxID=3346260 RepID=UPI003698337F